MFGLPWRPSAVFFGASATFQGGSAFAGNGAPERTDYAGLGFSARRAFFACIGEAAEHQAMLVREMDSRIADDGTIGVLTVNFEPAGRMEASAILRQAGTGGPPHPHTSTGFAAGPTRKAAAESAVFECYERHALAVWFSGGCTLVELSLPELPASDWASAQDTGAGFLRLFRVELDLKNIAVVIALSQMSDGGLTAGYGCAADEQTAALKAFREACQGEFGLQLEKRNAKAAGAGIAFPHLARSAMFKSTPGLFDAREIRPMRKAEIPGMSILEQLDPEARLIELTIAETGIPVFCAIVPGLRDITAERQGRIPWPV